MDKKIFNNVSKTFSIIMFIQNDTFQGMKKSIEELGKQKNLKLVVQPCPFEAVEFLFHVQLDLPSGIVSEEKDFFWHALELKKNLDAETLEKISDHHHKFLVSILQNESKTVQKERKALESLIQKNS